MPPQNQESTKPFFIEEVVRDKINKSGSYYIKLLFSFTLPLLGKEMLPIITHNPENGLSGALVGALLGLAVLLVPARRHSRNKIR